MALISLQDITLRFGGPPVLQDVNLQLEAGERVCVVGRNGEGKSTLLRMLAGTQEPDAGRVIRRKGLVAASLDQEIPAGVPGTVAEVVAGGLATRPDAAEESWRDDRSVALVIERLGLDGTRTFAELSGGMKRRALLARALVSEPDLLLLDEPTNHLDIDAVLWLEEFLLGSGPTLVFVSHDRALVHRLATRILDLDRGRLTSWPGDYSTYERRRDEVLADEAARQAKFDRKLAQEEVWIRKGIKARRTRNEGRARTLAAMRRERQDRRDALGDVKLRLTESAASGKLVARARGLGFGYDGTPLIRDFSATILRGDRIGIVGPNGCGKTTLIKLLLGNLNPDAGTIVRGARLDVAYFDQNRDQLDPDASVAHNVADGQDTITLGGGRKHVIGYLGDFLFTPDRARSPVSMLSGGERNRLLLARLFARPANTLVLDEPTNDLDAETLDLLEERVGEFAGTVLLVSHDRTFLDNVVTSTLAFDGDGVVKEYAGGYAEWFAQRPSAARKQEPKEKKPRLRSDGAAPPKLTYKEKAELAELPARIERLEAEQAEIFARTTAPDFYQSAPREMAAVNERLAALEAELAASYARWEELEGMASRHAAWKNDSR
ncbi:MAG: ATP-binding cassette domain-containing protein [bacterium]|nr:ATP-binding cassette domain-containing protein [bacterium]